MKREEAIQILRTQYPHDAVIKEALGLLIPELRESEDERIRKELIEFIKWSVDRHFMREDFHQAKRPSEWIAYLEKQKLEEVQGPPQEEKQVSLNYEPPFDENPSDKEIIEALIHHLNEQNGFLTAINCVSTKAILNWLKKQKEQDKCPEYCVRSHCIGCSIYEKQKEQKPIDYPYLPGWRKNRDNNKPELKRSVLMLTTHGVAEGEWLGEKWCQYRWSCELKDGEVLYWIHLSDLERLEKEGEEKQKEPENTGASTMAPSCWEVEQKEQKPAEKSSTLQILKEHLANTPREQLDAEFEALKDLTIDKPAEWKPSEEQMEAFRIYLYNPQYIDNSEDKKIKLVESLYNDLKKLM